MRSLRDDGLLLPRHHLKGPHAGQIVWNHPSQAALYELLRNPAYAGAFVYGRRRAAPERRPGHRGRRRYQAIADWTVLRQDVYPAYITWEQFVTNQTRMSENASDFSRRTRGSPRQGTALLAGLVVCGHCGRQMRSIYKPSVRYLCNAANRTYGAPMCLHLDGASIEAVVVEAFFSALTRAELDLLDEVLAAQAADQERVQRQHAEQVARAEYEARLAQKQYEAVDPENRLVAAELERRWEHALQALARAREAAEQAAAPRTPPARLDPILREQLRDLGPRMPELWMSGRLSVVHKKELLRCLIRRILLTRPLADEVEVKVVWMSGAVSVLRVRPPIWRTADVSGYEQVVARIRELSAAGYQDVEIARQLKEEGFHGARSPHLDAQAVGKIRRKLGQVSLTGQHHRQVQVDGQWTVSGLARHLGVTYDWLYRRIRRGQLKAEFHPLTKQYLIADDPEQIAAVQAKISARDPRGIHVGTAMEGGAPDAQESESAHD
jgi:hypothetical protein